MSKHGVEREQRTEAIIKEDLSAFEEQVDRQRGMIRRKRFVIGAALVVATLVALYFLYFG